MDKDFLAELEEKFTNVGADKCWKRSIGGREVWFSPCTHVGQVKVSEIMANPDFRASVIAESKRMTLAHSIVGVDSVDLRQYRQSGSMFPILDPRTKKLVEVDLPTYIHHKIQTWGYEFIENAFDVFADLMETHKRENLKEVKFENSKDPRIELAEHEARAAEIREQLGMPQRTEPDREEVEEHVVEERLVRAPEPQAKVPEKARIPDDVPVIDFDPFERMDNKPANQQPVVSQPPPPVARMRPVSANVPPGAVVHTALPSVQPEVITQPSERAVTNAPVVDNMVQGVNPRFRKP